MRTRAQLTQPAGGAAAAAPTGATTTTGAPTAANVHGRDGLCNGGAAPAEGSPAAASSDGAAAAAAAAAPGSLSCCPHCHWGWTCAEHRAAYLSGPHPAVCLSYQCMNESQLLTQRYLLATGRLPNYVPDKPRPAGQIGEAWEPVPAGWPAFQAWRPLPAFDRAMMGLLSKRLSQALTVVQVSRP